MRFLLFIFLFSSTVYAIPEELFDSVWKSRALPFYQSLPVVSFPNSQGLTLKFSYLFNARNERSLVIAPGRTEPAVKYAELVYDLRDSGFNIFIIDHQGQGESERLEKGSFKGDVLRFSDYVNDFALFITRIREISSQPLYLVAHSMGGAIAVRYMSLHPETFTKAALIAPMLEINTAPYPETIARLYSTTLAKLGRGRDYAPGYGPYDPATDTFEDNTDTHSEARFRASRFLLTSRPELVLGGPTVRWVKTALWATKKIDQLKIQTPVVLFQATEDVLVKPRRQTSWCSRNDCELITIEGSHHEILMEKDSLRDKAMKKIRSFFAF